MEQQEKTRLREYCVVGYRRAELGVEFCLVSSRQEGRWEFPKVTVEADQGQLPSLDEIAAIAGLHGTADPSQPLGEFVWVRGGAERTVISFLMEVETIDPGWQDDLVVRRLWCLAEEGRVRIRRKPLRRFFDLALRAIDARPRLVAPER